MIIKPVKNKKDYNEALKRIETLMSAKKNTKEGDELDVLVTLVEAYEEKTFPIESPDPVAVIEHCMEALGMDRKDLEPILGSKSRVFNVSTSWTTGGALLRYPSSISGAKSKRKL